MLYQNCRELSCHIFNEICISGDLNLLIKNDEKYSIDDLITQWHLIIDEFNDLTNNTESKKDLKNRIEVIYLQNILHFCYFVKNYKNFPLSEEVELIIQNIQKEHKIKNIDLVIAKSNNRLNTLLNESLKDQEKTNKIKGFDEIFANFISDGTSFNRHKTTVAEFAYLLNIIKKKNTKQHK